MAQLFYKKEMKEKVAKSLWFTHYRALSKSVEDPDLWRLSVMGFYKIRLTFVSEEAGTAFFQTLAVDMRS